MHDPNATLDTLFDFGRLQRHRDGVPEPAPEAESERPPRKPRGRLIRNTAALKDARAEGREDTKRTADDLLAAANAMRSKLQDTRRSLGPAAEARIEARIESPTEAPARKVRALAPIRSRSQLPVGSMAPAPVAAPLEQESWRLEVVLNNDEHQSFFLRATDAVDAALRGARDIAGWVRQNRPGTGWRIGSLELLRDVLV